MVELICSSAAPGTAYGAALALAEGIADLLGWEVADSDSGEVLHTAPAGCDAGCPACATPQGRRGRPA
ncbi:hypothetical protein ACFV0O_40805 [Kitasatospora sp. NPDC059577]|uniref:hypothetical protein n=1 Tax=unclassified Kitasatospora TaxID=2633591 RepID=UPI003679FCF3